MKDLLDLFTFEKKSDLTRHCRTVTIAKSDLASLIFATMSGRLPWEHRAHHRQFVPDHLDLTEDDRAAMATNGVGPLGPTAKKAANKIGAIFDERRLLSGHIFFNSDFSDWHFFYFDQRDMARRKNHWDGGAHIHFINKLWPNRTAQSVWEEFCMGNPQMRGALHIRFDDRRDEPGLSQKTEG